MSSNVALPLNSLGYAIVASNAATTKSPSLTFTHTGTGVYTFVPGVAIDAGTTIAQALLTGATGFVRAGVDSSNNVVVRTFNVDGTTAADKDFSLIVWVMGVSAKESNP